MLLEGQVAAKPRWIAARQEGLESGSRCPDPTMWTTNSGSRFKLATVSFSTPSRGLIDRITVGGSTPIDWKKLNGAAFGPSAPSMVTSAIGHGMIDPVMILY